MEIEWVEDDVRFAALAQEWERLADRQGLPFLRHAWFCAWWTAFAAGRRLCICTAWDGGELVAAFPLCRRGRRLEPLANGHTPFFAPLARDPPALRAVIDAALDASPTLALGSLPHAHPAIGILAERGRLMLTQTHLRSPYVKTDGSVEDYWAHLSGKARRDFRRCRQLLANLPDVEQSILEKPLDLTAELAHGFAVEGSAWKSKRGTAIADSPETLTFYNTLATRFMRLDKLRLSTLRSGGQVMAFNFNLLDFDRVWGLKGGYNVEFSRYAPGVLLLLAEVERCFEIGVASIELLGDEEPWKRKLTRNAHSQTDVQLFARRPLPLARYGYGRYMRPQLKRFYRSLFPERARP